MSFRLDSLHGDREKAGMVMRGKRREIGGQNKGEDLLTLLKFRDTLAGKLQETGGQGTIAKVVAGVKTANPETIMFFSFPAEMQEGNGFIIAPGHDKVEPFC